jgi:hypothetical protein
LQGLTHLQTLSLSGTRITNSGLARLRTLADLQSLFLARTSITDEGLARLGPLDAMYSLDVCGTRVSAECIRKLQADLPGLSDVAFDTHTQNDSGPDSGK